LPVDERDDPRRDEERDGPDHPRERFHIRGASTLVKQMLRGLDHDVSVYSPGKAFGDLDRVTRVDAARSRSRRAGWTRRWGCARTVCRAAACFS
jgi:hypothetical protein